MLAQSLTIIVLIKPLTERFSLSNYVLRKAEWRFGLKLWNDSDGKVRYIMLSIRAFKASFEVFLDTDGVRTRSSMSN